MDEITDFFESIVQEKDLIAINLVNSDGLLIAQYQSQIHLGDEQLIVFSDHLLKFRSTCQNIKGLSAPHELIVEEIDGRKIVTRFIQFLNQLAILSVTLHPKRPYKAIINKCQKFIEAFDL